MSVSDTVSSVTFGPVKGFGTHCLLLKMTQVICQKCACMQQCCANSSATRLTPRCPRVIRQEYSELYQSQSQDLHSAMWFHPHVNPYDSYCNMHTTCMLQHERMGAWASPPGVENQLLKWCLYRGVGSSGGPKREQGFPSHLGFPSHMGFPTHLGFPNPPSLRQVETSL